MNWLLKLITGNPLVLLCAALAVFGFGVASGGSAAWFVQGLRVTHAEQEFTKYKQGQTMLIQEAKDAADRQREHSGAAYLLAIKQLDAALADGDALRRCVAAGKCGVRVPSPAACPGYSIPAAARTDAASPDPVPVAGEDAAINDCARTTLMINRLQDDIAAQPGYSREASQ